MENLSVDDIARVCHEANRALQFIAGDPAPSVPWPAESEETRESARHGVVAALAGRTPEQMHEEWCRWQREHDWRYGEVKDALAKTHPCMVPYGELPPDQRVKDRLFVAIVTTLGDPSLPAGSV